MVHVPLGLSASDPVVVHNSISLRASQSIWIMASLTVPLRAVRPHKETQIWNKYLSVNVQQDGITTPADTQYDSSDTMHAMLEFSGLIKVSTSSGCSVEAVSPLGSYFATRYSTLPRELQLNIQRWLARGVCTCPIPGVYTESTHSFAPTSGLERPDFLSKRAHGDPFTQGLLYPWSLGTRLDTKVDFQSTATELYYSTNCFLLESTNVSLHGLRHPPAFAFAYIRRLEVRIDISCSSWMVLDLFCKKLPSLSCPKLEHMDVNVWPVLEGFYPLPGSWNNKEAFSDAEDELESRQIWDDNIATANGMFDVAYAAFVDEVFGTGGEKGWIHVPVGGRLQMQGPVRVMTDRTWEPQSAGCGCTVTGGDDVRLYAGDCIDTGRQEMIESVLRAHVLFAA